MDKLTKMRNVFTYSTVCLYLLDMFLATSNASYPSNNGTSIAFIGVSGYHLFKQYREFKEETGGFSKATVVFILWIIGFSLFDLGRNFASYFGWM